METELTRHEAHQVPQQPERQANRDRKPRAKKQAGGRPAEPGIEGREPQTGGLVRASRQLHGAADARTMLRIVLRSAVEMAGASGGVAGLVSGDELLITESLGEGGFREVMHKRHLESRGIVIENGRVHCRIVVPVADSSSEPLACFEVCSATRQFDMEDAALLQGLACVAALALENLGMRSERFETNQASAAASSLLSATIESTVDGIMAVDRHGEIVACNRRFAEMWSAGHTLI